jgi:hypothetical protein
MTTTTPCALCTERFVFDNAQPPETRHSRFNQKAEVGTMSSAKRDSSAKRGQIYFAASDSSLDYVQSGSGGMLDTAAINALAEGGGCKIDLSLLADPFCFLLLAFWLFCIG